MILKFIKSSYTNVKTALSKTGSLFGSKLKALFGGEIDSTTFDKLEELLYQADLGVEYARELTDMVEKKMKEDPRVTSEQLIESIRETLLKHLNKDVQHQTQHPSPTIILVVGVNGNGKTTSLAKLAHRFHLEGKKIIIGAADTFRAAATEQLELWAHRLNVDIVRGTSNSDPAAVTFDTVSAGVSRHADIVLIDTAGRLHTKMPLMQELEKIRRSCKKVIPDSPHETYLVLDATAGQNAVDQARVFQKYTPISGLILTKLDGTAKGGAALAIQRKLGIPIRFIGVGEGVEDLQPFDAQAFVDAILE